MANEENLIPMDERSQNEARELGKKGGKKSGEARRRKKDMKAKMKLLLSLHPTASQTELLKALGIPEEDADNEMLLLVVVAVRLDVMLGTSYVRDAVCIGFCCNELLSIIENAGLLGVPLPVALKNAVELLQKKEK